LAGNQVATIVASAPTTAAQASPIITVVPASRPITAANRTVKAAITVTSTRKAIPALRMRTPNSASSTPAPRTRYARVS